MIDHADTPAAGRAPAEETSRRRSGRPAPPRAALWIQRGAIALGILSLLAIVQALPAGQAVSAAAAWIEGLGALAPFAFIVIYFLATILMLPASLLSIAAGVLFGLWTGTLLVLAGATCGMAGAFVIGRRLARGTVEAKVRKYPRAAAIDRAVGEGGWKIVALLRLSPVVPFNLQNYLYGITAIRFWPCIAASAAAIIPGTFMYVYLGYAGRVSLAAAGSGGADRGIAQWSLMGIGLLATIAVTVMVTRMAQKALREQSEMQPPETEEEQNGLNAESSPSRPWLKAGAAAAAALLLLSCAVAAQMRPAWIMSLAGPPAVVMQESYATKDGGPTFDHGPFDQMVRQYVNDAGGVDYAALQADADALHEYTASLADAPFDAMGRDEKLALLINAYNSFHLVLILEWLDQDIDSIKNIPSDKRWADQRWNVGGHVWSLNQIEHEQIRPHFREPNIHWALVCAAVGCPPLRREAYAAERIEEQLRDQAAIVHRDGSRWFRHDPSADTVRLTRLYQWYGEDFKQIAGSELEFAAEYSESLAQAMAEGSPPTVHWLEYDWSLNNQENLP